MTTATQTAVKEITRLRDLGSGRRDAVMIDPRIIEIEEGHNPRNYALKENRDHLDELKANIKQRGTLNPLWVRYEASSKTAILVDGECRLRANLELIAEGEEILTVPCIQVAAGNEAERLLLSLTANTGKPLSKWESGTAFVRLTHFGWTEEKIATSLGFKLRFVTEAIELNDAPEAVKQLLSEQAITPSLAIAELRKSGAAAVEVLQNKATEAKAEGKTAKRDRAQNHVSLKTLVISLLESANQSDLGNKERDNVRVSKKILKQLLKAV